MPDKPTIIGRAFELACERVLYDTGCDPTDADYNFDCKKPHFKYGCTKEKEIDCIKKYFIALAEREINARQTKSR